MMDNQLGSNTPLEVTIQDNGKLVSLAAGAELLVHLRTNPTTGFDWQNQSPDNPSLREISRSYHVLSDALGSPSDLTIRFKAIEQGQTHLELHYRRPWEESIPPGSIFALDIDIQTE